MKMLNVVVETPTFLHAAASFWDDSARAEFVAFIAEYCDAGDLIPGTGGLRKIRWGRDGIGKRGGARVVYYYYNSSAPLYLLYVYPKNSQETLTPDDTRLLRSLVEQLKREIKAAIVKQGGNHDEKKNR